MKTRINLNSDQKEKLVEFWNSRKSTPPSVREMVLHVWGELPEADLDERSLFSLAVRHFLAVKAKKGNTVELSETDKEYIRNNHAVLSATEMARTIWNNPQLWTGHPETRAVIKYLREIKPAFTYDKQEEARDFNPPRREDQVIKLVNRIVLNAFDPERIDGATKKMLFSCVHYYNNERFLTEIESYQEGNERKTFIHNFIRHTYDKPDLTQQDVDTIILYSKEIIEHNRIEKHIAKLEEKFKDSDSEDGGKMSLALVQAIDGARDKLSKSKKLQSDLSSEINEKRRERLKKQLANNNSLLNLVAAWKEEESRLKMIKLAEERKKVLGDKVDELNDMNEIDARIFGLNKDELLYGGR